MPDINDNDYQYAEDLPVEDHTTLDGSEKFVMFDSQSGKQASLAEVTEYMNNRLDVGMKDNVKEALLGCFEHVGWIDEHGKEYYDALKDALYPRTLLNISASFDSQGHTIYDSNTLDSLKQYLTVTANYSDETSEVVTNYTLSGRLAAGTRVITVAYSGKTTAFNVTVVAKSLTSISAVFNQGSDTIYTDNTLESLKQYLTVTAHYNDSSSAIVTNYTLSGTLVEGTSTITVTYSGKTTTFNVAVTESEATLTNISASFDSQGHTIYDSNTLDSLKQYLTVTAHYDDSTSEAVTNYTLSGTLAAGTSVITVTYRNKTTTFNVTVVAKSLTSISAVFNQGSAIIYTDDTLDSLKQYLTVTANYNDSTSETINNYTLSGTLVEGTSTITVTYSGKTTTFNATVSEKATPIYALPTRTVLNGTSDYIDTQLQLMKNEQSFTIFADFYDNNASLANEQYATLFHCMLEDNTHYVYPGISFHFTGIANQSDKKRLQLSYNAVSSSSLKSIWTDLSNISLGNIRMACVVNTVTHVMTMHLNINGNVTSSNVSNIAFSSVNETLLIGAYRTQNDVKGRFFNGTINEFIVYEGAFSSAECNSYVTGV